MALVKYNNNSISDVTSAASAIGGAMTLISTTTASSSSTVSITSGIDNTYPIYLFKFIDIHASNDDVHFQFNASDDTSSHSYDVTKTTTVFTAYHNEGGSDAALAYQTAADIAQGTGFQNLTAGDTLADNNDRSLAGFLCLFNPSSTTFVKHFIAETTVSGASNYNSHPFVAGYFNTTSAITALQFKAASGNIDSGTIKLYGIKDS
tara:strand:- start:241 stop:858 length:618 start_codon:yes stop_codon:yes gene_type:complete